jgi:Arylsulfotransferase (ASST)
VIDCLIQERDVASGQLLWEWHALGHIPLSDSYISAPSSSTPYDYFHLNSIQPLPNGNLLISARNTWSVYEIDRQTADVIWTLGGKRSNFKLSPGARFEWQHDARLHAGNALTVFDDAADPFSQEESQSSAKTLRLSEGKMTVSLVRGDRHQPPLLSEGDGSAQLLSNHDMFVRWGNQPDFTEFASGGQQIFNGSFPIGVTSYRAYRFRWDGRPSARPSISIAPQTGGAGTVYCT